MSCPITASHSERSTRRAWKPPGSLAGICVGTLLALALGAETRVAGQAPITGPLRASTNPNYFQDTSGSPLILCGSQTWNTLQDWGTGGSVQPLDFDAFVSFLKAHGHNFTLLWRTELPRFSNLPVTATHPPDFTVSPHPWMRTGPGLATDGGLKFDLTKFNHAYFDRLRTRVDSLNRAGIYAGVYLFTGEFLLRFRCPTDGYPFSGPNNVNEVDDGYRGGPAESGLASVTMTGTNVITDLQDAYVRKTIDTLNDLPNVLWIVSEEAPMKSTWWNNHLISLVRAYERGKPHQHPVGYATLESPTDSILYNSDADWVAPWAWISPATSCGTGIPSCKVNVNDSDHSYFGMWNDTPQKNRNYAWENFMTGNQVLFMDPYLVYYPRENRNLCLSPINGIGSRPDPRWENFRNNLGCLLRYSRKLNLANVIPTASLCSTKFCLAQTPTVGAEYLAYAPAGGAFTLDLSAMPNSRRLAVEWFNPATGETITESPIAAGSVVSVVQSAIQRRCRLILGGHRGPPVNSSTMTTSMISRRWNGPSVLPSKNKKAYENDRPTQREHRTIPAGFLEEAIRGPAPDWRRQHGHLPAGEISPPAICPPVRGTGRCASRHGYDRLRVRLRRPTSELRRLDPLRRALASHSLVGSLVRLSRPVLLRLTGAGPHL